MFLSFNLLIGCIVLFDFQVLSQPYIPYLSRECDPFYVYPDSVR